jgi:hypothetical protein
MSLCGSLPRNLHLQDNDAQLKTFNSQKLGKSMVLHSPRKMPVIDFDVIEANPGLQRVIGLLANAESCAQGTESSPWEFAVELEVLIAEGLTANDVRWLVKMGYVEHAYELTRSHETTRRFRSCCNLGFGKRTCFILTASGAMLAASHKQYAPPKTQLSPAIPFTGGDADSAQGLPSWDSDRRILRMENRVVKQFKVPSPSQEAILAAFEEEGWPSAIDDPLPPQPEQDSKRRLRNTIQSLNANQKNPILRFRGDGSGQRIIWEFFDNKATQPTAKKRRFINAA